MIKIGEKDSIIDIVNKINECSDNELFLEFPKNHPILHNYMSLKILKNKAGNKRITLLCADIVSKKIGTPLGINYSLIKDEEYFKELGSKQEILKHNYTFFEYLIFEIKKYFTRFLNFLGRKTGIEKLKYYNPYNKVKTTGVFVLFFGFLVSLGMLAFIFYFAVSKTFIDIVPEINIKTQSTNIVFSETSEVMASISQQMVVPVKKVSHTVSLTYTHKTTGIDYENTKRAKGEVTLVNELREEQTFRPKTRLLSKEGILFETDDWVKIPGKIVDGSGQTIFGMTKVNITAKIYDDNGKFIGERGNIKEGTFTIPGLKFSQDKIYAKLEKPTSGGENNISYVVGETDEENAKKIIEATMKKNALDELKKKIEEENKITGGKSEILGIKDIVTYKNIIIKPIKKIEKGQKIDKFDLQGSITIETYTYNKNTVLNILKNVVGDSLLDGTDKLMFIDENSIRMTAVLERNEQPFNVKATVEVDIGVSFDFDNNQNYSNQKLKTQILGLPNDEAINILLNEEKISSVTIKNTPFFIKRVSSNMDNLILKIKQE